ncbi:hypothetical protein F4775DRAFT_578469 [Biscogniauxia sp. FL1348]|nr:hypothetical protein F4775DRAFT_578469 [Biscogniauxia sp. FL1348]
MDWLSDSDPFIAPNNFDLFDYEFRVRNIGQVCTVIQNLGLNPDEDATKLALNDSQCWQRWMESFPMFVWDANQRNFTIADLPEDRFSILCVPQAEQIRLENGYQRSAYTDLPLDEVSWDYWQKVARAFHLPGHFPKLAMRKQTSATCIARTIYFSGDQEKLWMHTAVTNPDFDEGSFAMAATHFEKKNLTLAVMFGCSDDQIMRIQGLVNTSEGAKKHPLLMLGIYAELQLDRLVAMVEKSYKEYEKLVEDLERQLAGDVEERNPFSWKTIREVRLTREAGKKVEAEVETTKLQLSKACSSALQTLESLNDSASTETAATTEAETTNIFSERFNDIATRLDGLSARCRNIVEGITFTTEIITSELSRQDSQTSTANSKFATGISLVAMIYLPLTTMATIFAMPIFQWSNDWRDWRYLPVDDGNGSSTTSDPSSPNDTMSPPVVSGYVWIYLSISIGLTLITYFGFRFYIRYRDRVKGSPVCGLEILVRRMIGRHIPGTPESGNQYHDMA